MLLLLRGMGELLYHGAIFFVVYFHVDLFHKNWCFHGD